MKIIWIQFLGGLKMPSGCDFANSSLHWAAQRMWTMTSCLDHSFLATPIRDHNMIDSKWNKVRHLTWENGPMKRSGWWRLHCTFRMDNSWQRALLLSGEWVNLVVATIIRREACIFSLSCQIFLHDEMAVWYHGRLVLRGSPIKIDHVIFCRIHHAATTTSRATICYTSEVWSALESHYGYSMEKDAAS